MGLALQQALVQSKDHGVLVGLFDLHVDVGIIQTLGAGLPGPGTGADRLAAAVGANTIYPNSDILIVDFGTAITIDVVSGGEFLGGNITPGAAIRFKALHHFTKKLPLCSLNDNPTELFGNTSVSAIECGVVNGIVYEIEGYIRDLQRKYSDLRIIFTGGDSNFFAKRLKNTIFATYDLVAYGLNRILEYNAE